MSLCETYARKYLHGLQNEILTFMNYLFEIEYFSNKSFRNKKLNNSLTILTVSQPVSVTWSN